MSLPPRRALLALAHNIILKGIQAMPEYSISASLKAPGSVLEMKTVDNCIVIFDAAYCLSRISVETLKPLSKTIIKKGVQPMYAYSKSISICKNGAILMSIDGGSKAYTLSLKDEVLKQEGVFEYFKGGVITSAISKSCSLCMCGSDTGELALFDFKKLTSVGAFDMHGDYVSQIEFCSKDKFCVVSYYDKKTIIYDMLEMNMACSFSGEAVIERSVFVDKLEAFICVSRSGDIEAFSPIAKKRVFSYEGSIFWATDIIAISEDVVAISSREGRLYFFDVIEKEFLVTISPMENIGISKLHKEDDKLFIGLSSGNIIVVDMSLNANEFASFVEKSEWKSADELIEKNFFLCFNSKYKEELKKVWEAKKEEIIGFIRIRKPQDAYALAKPFLRFKAMKDEFESIMAQSEDVLRFFEAMRAGDYAGAYKIANLSKSIKQLKVYAELETIFENSMKSSITMLEEDELRNKASVLAMLKPFATVPMKKEIVTDLLKNWDKYREFLINLKNREFGSAFALASRFPFLKETAAYKKTVNMGDGLLQKLAVLDGEGAYEQALEISKLLESFGPYRTIAVAKSTEYSVKIRALKIINEYKKKTLTPIGIASFVNDNVYLDGFEVFDDFLLYMQAEIKAIHEEYKENPEEFWQLTKQYAYISKLKNFTLTLLREAYIEELKNAAIEQSASVDWRASFDKLSAIFEIDAKTESFAYNMGVKLDVKERDKKINIELLPKSMIVFIKS